MLLGSVPLNFELPNCSDLQKTRCSHQIPTHFKTTTLGYRRNYWHDNTYVTWLCCCEHLTPDHALAHGSLEVSV